MLSSRLVVETFNISVWPSALWFVRWGPADCNMCGLLKACPEIILATEKGATNPQT